MNNNGVKFEIDKTLIFDRTVSFEIRKNASLNTPPHIIEIEDAFYRTKQHLWSQSMLTFNDTVYDDDYDEIDEEKTKLIEKQQFERAALPTDAEELTHRSQAVDSPATSKYKVALTQSLLQERATLTYQDGDAPSSPGGKSPRAKRPNDSSGAGSSGREGSKSSANKPSYIADKLFGYGKEATVPLYTSSAPGMTMGTLEGIGNLVAGTINATSLSLYIPLKMTKQGYDRGGFTGASCGFLAGTVVGPVVGSTYMAYSTAIAFKQMGKGMMKFTDPSTLNAALGLTTPAGDGEEGGDGEDDEEEDDDDGNEDEIGVDIDVDPV